MPNGLTKTEVLVCLGVLGVVTALVAPAIVGSRDSARLAHCRRNLQQVGVALRSYHDVHGSLPAAAVWKPGKRRSLALHATGRIDEVTYANWVQLLLPQLGEDALASRFDDGAPVADAQNAAARTTEFALFSCPSDSFNRADNHYAFQGAADAEPVHFARGNYAINGGSHNHRILPGTSAMPVGDGPHLVMDRDSGTFKYWGSGVAGVNTSFTLDDFTNGLATTVAVDEVRAGVHPFDPRGVWSLGQIGGSITWAHGVNGDAFGPNNSWARSDDVIGCGKLQEVVGGDELSRLRMPCCVYCKRNDQATARSLHDGGVHVLMMDGSVHFVSNNVDPGLWHVMHSRETPEEILSDDLAGQLKVVNHPEAGAAAASSTSGGALPETLENSVGMRFVRIPAGEFLMAVADVGNTAELRDEFQSHRVRITRSFHLGVCEVTQEQYERVVGDNPSWHAASGGGVDDLGDRDWRRLPVEQVTWNDANEFCRKLSALPAERKAGRVYRLPTEAEWEYACRAGGDEPYRWRKRREQDDRSGENAGVLPPLPIVAVGSYAANAFGLFDMRGNVYEWCGDWFDRDYYSRSPVENPQGPARGYLKVVRGGDWQFTGETCKINYPVSPPWKSSRFIGFRIVCEQQD